MFIGAHISTAGDIALAPLRAVEIGCECFQFFSRPPQGGKGKPLSPETIDNFITACQKYKLDSYIHAPYYINLASANPRIYHGSITVIREELERASALGVNALMTHLGSARELGDKKGVAQVIKGIAAILEKYKGTTKFLLEISAGTGMIIGDTFEEIAAILHAPQLKKYNIGVCFDTAHAFASGYDLRDKKTVAATFKKFDALIGLKNLTLIHANDSMADFNAKKDRHEHIGQGKIGLAGFKEIVTFAQKNNINMILETPHDEYLDEDIKILKKMKK